MPAGILATRNLKDWQTMYACRYECIYVCMCVCICAYMLACRCVYTCMYAYMCACMHRCMYVSCRCACTCGYMNVCWPEAMDRCSELSLARLVGFSIVAIITSTTSAAAASAASDRDICCRTDTLVGYAKGNLNGCSTENDRLRLLPEVATSIRSRHQDQCGCSAAFGILSRHGLGKVRHLGTNHL